MAKRPSLKKLLQNILLEDGKSLQKKRHEMLKGIVSKYSGKYP